MVTIVNTALHVSMLSRKQIFRVLITRITLVTVHGGRSRLPVVSLWHTQTLDHHAAQLQLTYHAPLYLHRRAISAWGNPNAWGQQTHPQEPRTGRTPLRARLPLFFSLALSFICPDDASKTEDTWLLALHTLKAFGNTDEDSQGNTKTEL